MLSFIEYFFQSIFCTIALTVSSYSSVLMSLKPVSHLCASALVLDESLCVLVLDIFIPLNLLNVIGCGISWCCLVVSQFDL